MISGERWILPKGTYDLYNANILLPKLISSINIKLVSCVLWHINPFKLFNMSQSFVF